MVQAKAELLPDGFKRNGAKMKLLSNAPDPLGIASIGFMPKYKGQHLLG